jgi:fatty acyl-CoA reductase
MMKFSNSVESGTKLPETEIDWKNAIDKYIYGIRKFYLKEKLNEMHVYLKYGVLRPSPGFRKHNFFHWSFIKQKVRNVNEIDTELYKGRLLNNQRLRKAIDNDLSEFLKSNPNADERELEDRKRKIDVDLNMSFDALRTHFEKLGLFTLVLPTHFMMRKMFDGVYFDNKFIEYVRNHDYRNGPLIFLPTHRSYIDFLLISYLLVIRDGQPPFIGAADNMNNIFFVSELFHRSGAFYIKRTGQKFPKIYRTLLNEYMKLILENEINIEFFIEASRSRTG